MAASSGPFRPDQDPRVSATEDQWGEAVEEEGLHSEEVEEVEDSG
jgi:hypothetical protein